MGGNEGSGGWMVPEPVEVARLEERRQAFGVAMIADESVESMGGTLCVGPPGSWMNKARGIGLDGAVTGDEIDAMIAFYRERGHPASVETVPFVDQSLLDGLAARGFTIEEFVTCWAIDVGRPSSGRAADGIRLGEIDRADPLAVSEWAGVLAGGFSDAGSEGYANGVVAMTRVAAQDGVVCLGAFDGDTIVGASAMEVSSPIGGRAVAGLFSASVQPSYRGRGIQSAMIEERVRLAAQMGAWVAVIESKPGVATERNARRLGFVPVYTKTVLTQR